MASALISTIFEKLEGKGCKSSWEWQGKLNEEALASIANVLLALVTFKSEVMLCWDDPDTTAAVVAVFKKYLAPDWEKTAILLPVSEMVILDLHDIQSFHITHIENLAMVLKHCLEMTLQFAAGILTKSNESVSSGHLKRVLEFIEQEDNIPSTPYFSGSVLLKEENTFLFTTKTGLAVQVGIPPETIKTSMRQGKTPPQVYILPPKLMRDFGDINYGEVEFPIFFNFFVKKAFAHPENKVIMVGAAETLARVRVLLQESVFGPKPEHLYVDEDIAPKRKADGYWVDLQKERSFLAFKDKSGGTPPMEAFADFKAFDAHGEASLPEFRVQFRRGLLRFFDPPASAQPSAVLDISGGGDARSASSTFREMPSDELCDAVPVFQPPVLGVTFIGTSHGFDPKGRTTGFIIWINGQGVLVDPPVQTTEFLQRSGIHRRTVNKVILTHCHSDHDSGLLRKILEGEKIELYTLKTVHESYKRKLQAITGRTNVGDYYTYRQVKIGEPLNIHGAVFDFDFAFHTIPACRFKLCYKGKSISYSADTYYNAAALALLTKQGTMNPAREISLRMWLFDADLIIHEAGVPPIHTDLLDLNALPTSTKKKLLVVHTASIPAAADRCNEDGTKTPVPLTDLRIPKCGVQNTVVIPVGDYLEGYSKATRLFRMFCNVFYFRNLPPAKLFDLFAVCEEVTFLPGDVIIRSGQPADTFYLIECGQVEVWGLHQSPASSRTHSTLSSSAGATGPLSTSASPSGTPQSPKEPPRELLASLVRGESFGEAALAVSGSRIPRVADVIAKTHCTLFALHSRILHEVLGPDGHLAHLPHEEDLQKVQKYRPFIRDVLGKSFLFKNLKADQIELIAALIDEEQTYAKDAVIFEQGHLDTSLYLVKEGSVRLSKSVPEDPQMVVEFLRLGVGQCFGEIALITGLPRTATAIANEPGTVLLKLKRENFTQIMDEYQNIRFHVMGLVEHRLEETQRVDTEVTKRAASPYRASRGNSTSNLLADSNDKSKTLAMLSTAAAVLTSASDVEKKKAIQMKKSLDEHSLPKPH